MLVYPKKETEILIAEDMFIYWQLHEVYAQGFTF